MSFLFLCVISFAQALVPLQASGSRAKVEFRLAQFTSGPGLTAAKVASTNEMVYLHKDVIIRKVDIVSARAQESRLLRGTYEVKVVFSKKAAKRLSEISPDRKPRPVLAILVDKKVFWALRISAPISEEVVISGILSTKEAEDLAGTLKPEMGKGVR